MDDCGHHRYRCCIRHCPVCETNPCVDWVLVMHGSQLRRALQLRACITRVTSGARDFPPEIKDASVKITGSLGIFRQSLPVVEWNY